MQQDKFTALVAAEADLRLVSATAADATSG
jgi:hypothetical protein